MKKRFIFSGFGILLIISMLLSIIPISVKAKELEDDVSSNVHLNSYGEALENGLKFLIENGKNSKGSEKIDEVITNFNGGLDLNDKVIDGGSFDIKENKETIKYLSKVIESIKYGYPIIRDIVPTTPTYSMGKILGDLTSNISDFFELHKESNFEQLGDIGEEVYVDVENKNIKEFRKFYEGFINFYEGEIELNNSYKHKNTFRKLIEDIG